MIKVALVRGRYLNNFEGQNYIFNKNNIKLTAISSLKPLDDQFPFPVIKLPSLADLQNVPFLSKPLKFISNRLLGDSQILFGLEKFANKFDIFQTADSHYYYSFQLANLRKKGLIKKLISTSWETIPFNNETIKQKKFIKEFTQSQTDLFICHTNRAKDCLIKEGIGENKIEVIKLGVDINRFKSQNSKVKDQSDKLKIKNIKILFVGRLVKEKGLPDLQEAIKQIEKSKFKSQNYKLKVKVIKGNINYREMPKVYQEADIFVLPSKTTKTWEEQYGMVLVEAMASGLPIVAYNTGAIAELVGEAGLLIKESDVNQLANSIKLLIENRDLRLKLGKIGRKRAEKYFDVRKTTWKIGKIYENIGRNID